ncbi:hypothetical protein D3C86_2148150 [compost metagenome]
MPTKRLAAVSEFLAASLPKSASYFENLLRIGTSAFFLVSLSSAPARIAWTLSASSFSSAIGF